MNSRAVAAAAPGQGEASLPQLLPLLWRQWQHHPWRHALLVLAVMLGVALAYSVQLINDSALSEFDAAARAAEGEPDFRLRARSGALDEALLDRLRLQPGVRQASPVVEAETYAQAQAHMDAGHTAGTAAAAARVPVRVLGVDALALSEVALQLMPRPAADEGRLAVLDPGAAFVSAAARQRLALADGDAIALQHGSGWQRLRVAGSVAAGGGPLVVVDVAAAQQLFGLPGRLSRIDVRLQPGQDAQALLQALALPADVRASTGAQASQRLATLSRAYRINLAVLALVALFVGGFLVFSVVSLSVAQRTPALALLGVLGLTARRRRQLVLVESTLLGLIGSALGLLLGAALAALMLRVLGGDLGGGFFAGVTAPPLALRSGPVGVYALLGVATAIAGAWLPARRAERLVPAQALKGMGLEGDPGNDAAERSARQTRALGLLLLAASGGLALLPPLAGVPLAAYASVAALLLAGVALVPTVVALLLHSRGDPQQALVLLARRRAQHQRATASATVATVVTSLALAVALTVMVASFRASVTSWLDAVLPADLYGRIASSAAADQAWFGAALPAAAARLAGVQRVQAQRVRLISLAPAQPAVTLLARPLPDPEHSLPLVSPVAPAHDGEPGVWISEAVATLYDAAPGGTLWLPISEPALRVRVRGVYRDYARQAGSITIDAGDYQRASGDERLNELAIWLEPKADAAAVLADLRASRPEAALLDFATTAELRATSLRIFDRSFAVTSYLQAVAILIGLVGIATSLSAQVLARRKEFGLLAHLGLGRAEVLAIVAGETALWLLAGTAIGLVLGLAIGAILVYVVNPQSFHWTMEMTLPAARLALLCAAVLVTGAAAAAWSARHALSRAAVLAVKEDW
ncbi:MAG: ABC transporter permease [Burkholderiales bacterium]|nr:ABC transporter permease [Burkholderiales bacterium]